MIDFSVPRKKVSVWWPLQLSWIIQKSFIRIPIASPHPEYQPSLSVILRLIFFPVFLPCLLYYGNFSWSCKDSCKRRSHGDIESQNKLFLLFCDFKRRTLVHEVVSGLAFLRTTGGTLKNMDIQVSSLRNLIQ